jgi:hypothetical protein
MYHGIAEPGWAKGDDLHRFFTNAPALLRDGYVTWGHFVQANELLFAPGPHNCPGEVIYAADPRAPLPPANLEHIARALFDLKGTAPAAAEERTIADYLANERIRVFGLPVPNSFDARAPCRISTVFFERRHLPDRKLTLSYFPLLISGREDGAAMVAPARYWPPSFVRLWR